MFQVPKESQIALDAPILETEHSL